MKNVINSAVHSVNTQSIDELLPFENRAVWIWHVTHQFVSYGHWRVILDMDIDDKKIVLSSLCTDSIMIDYWAGVDVGEQCPHGTDYIGRLAAIEYIIGKNEDTLLEFIAAQEANEEELNDLFNIE